MSEPLISRKDVDYVAKLARIAVSDEDAQKYQGQMERILEYVGQLKEVSTDQVAPTAHPHDVSNVFREDEARIFPEIAAMLANAPDREEAFFRVKKVIE